MSLISSSIPNLINGVSQQPFTLRLASQCEEQINGLSSVVDGLRKRPALKHRARLKTTPSTSAFTHLIDRDQNERYIVSVESGELQVHDLAGNSKTVNFPDGIAYLSSSDPEHDFCAVTVADYTFVVNKTITTKAKDGSGPTPRPFEGLIWVKQGAYSCTYQVAVDGYVVSVVTPDASVASNAAYIQTTYIAAQLQSLLAAEMATRGISVGVAGSIIYCSCTTRDFSMSVFDALGDTSLKLIKRSVQRFTDLPARGVAGFKVRVAGSNEANSDDYYVEFDASSGPFSGIWKETVADHIATELDGTTMPHLLVRDADGTFSFEEAVFDPRKVGDLDSNPWPSFVDRPIVDAFFHRNRLGFLADENIVLSQAGEFFKFFKASAQQSLDTDPIDVAVSHVKVSLLKAAVPFNESLLLFSEQTQFQMTKADLLTPKTVGVNVTTEFSANLTAKPVGAGTNVYFAQTRGAYSGLREYYTDSDTTTNDATDVTSHVPTYVPGNIRKMAATSNENTIVCLSDTMRDTVYVYRYYWNRQEKLQSSWSQWKLPAGSTVLDVGFLGSTLVLVTSRADGTYIETMDLAAGVKDGGLGYQVLLDRRMDQTSADLTVSTTAGGATRIALAFAPRPGEEWVVVAGEGNANYKAGAVLGYTLVGDRTFEVPKALTTFFIGVKYAFTYRFSPFVMREQAPGGQGMQAVTEGRLQIRKLSTAFVSTGYFRAEVTPRGRDTYRYVFSGRVLGSSNNMVGKTALETDTFHIPIVAKNDQVTIEIINDSHLPSTFLSAEWEAFYHLRSRRM